MAFLDNIGPRTKTAWDTITDVLSDDGWHSHQELFHAALDSSDLEARSIHELIRKGYRARHYTRRKPRGAKLLDAVYRRTDPKDGA